MCDHLEIGEFGAYIVMQPGTEETATLLKCSSCGKFLTLSSMVVPEENIVRRASVTRDNMRTMTVQLNSDIYERIQKLTSEEGGKQDPSVAVNELLALGLWKYPTIVPKANR